MSRKLVSYLLVLPVCVATVLISEALDLELESWGSVAVALVLTLLVTLVDREGFYGVERERKR